MNQVTTTGKGTVAIKDEKNEIRYIPFGAKDPIRLSVAIIRNFVAVPTRSGKYPSDRDCMRFQMLCQAQHLNPFAGDAYMIGYDSQDGPQFSMITAHQTLLKRAEASEYFDGMESGVIVKHKEDGELQELVGDFYMEDTFELLGAWARVHHKKHAHATVRRGALRTYKKAFGLWKDAAQHALMVVKCVEADALRSTFPTLMGGLYSEGEMHPGNVIDVSTVPANVVAIKEGETERGEPDRNPPETEQERGDATQGATAVVVEARKSGPTPQRELQDIVLAGGFNFDHFMSWATDTGQIQNADNIGSFDEVPEDLAKRLGKSKIGLLKGLAQVKARS